MLYRYSHASDWIAVMCSHACMYGSAPFHMHKFRRRSWTAPTHQPSIGWFPARCHRLRWRCMLCARLCAARCRYQLQYWGTCSRPAAEGELELVGVDLSPETNGCLKSCPNLVKRINKLKFFVNDVTTNGYRLRLAQDKSVKKAGRKGKLPNLQMFVLAGMGRPGPVKFAFHFA